MQAVDVRKRLQQCVTLSGDTLRLGADSIDLRGFSRVLLAAIGKAAVPMAEHAFGLLNPITNVSGVVVGAGPWDPPPGIQFFQGGHPVPDERSFAAGRALLHVVRDANEQTVVLFLISGGASAMAEVPLNPLLPVVEVASFYSRLLHSGFTIHNMNALRKHLSAIKGGRLALASGCATKATVLLSDVPPGMLDVIGSGPSLPDSSTVEDCRKLLTETPAFASLSPALKQFFAAMPETPKHLESGRLPSICFTALSSDSLVHAAKLLAEAAGYRVVVDNTCDDWGYAAAAQYLLKRIRHEAEREPARDVSPTRPLCLISAGEVTVTIPGAAGVGGRNQHWALETARLAAGLPGFAALSAGSDGVDGNSPAAGAVVDASTWSRAKQLGLQPDAALAHFDAYPLFAQLDDTVISGPLGNNLRDLRILLL